MVSLPMPEATAPGVPGRDGKAELGKLDDHQASMSNYPPATCTTETWEAMVGWWCWQKYGNQQGSRGFSAAYICRT